MASATNPALDPDLDRPDSPGHELAQFGAGCFWGVELAFQRVPGVAKTEVGYSQGHAPDPTYELVCSGTTNHVEVVRVQFDPEVCPYTDLLALFWSRHDPTTLNRQGGDVGAQYRSGIYYYNESQARLARESLEAKQYKKIVTTKRSQYKKIVTTTWSRESLEAKQYKSWKSLEAKQLEYKDKKIVTEILPAKRFYRAEEYHQQYLEKGGGQGQKQCAAKGCNDPIRCYG